MASHNDSISPQAGKPYLAGEIDYDWENGETAWERGDMFICGSYLVSSEKESILPSDMIETIEVL